VGSKSCQTFGDAWGTPLAFVRNCYAAEVQGQPYVKAAASDPYDPSPSHKAATKITWAQIRPPSSLTWSGGSWTSPDAYQTTANANHVPTVLSAGPNAKWDADLFGSGTDNLLGFRLRREGTQGN